MNIKGNVSVTNQPGFVSNDNQPGVVQSTGVAIPSRAKSSINSADVQATGNRFADKYHEFRKKQYESPAACYLNLNKVLYDSEMNFVENAIEAEVSDDCWKIMLETNKQFDLEINRLNGQLNSLWIKHCIAKYLGIVYTENSIEAQQKDLNNELNKLMSNKKLWDDFSTWVDKLLISQDGQVNPAFIKTRVSNLYQQIIDASEVDKGRLLDLISEYSDACADRAVVGLEKAEVVAQFINVCDDLKLNVLILEFKRHLIQTELVPAASSESVETYLFYSIYLNEVLMLKNTNKSMMHASISSKHSFDEAINVIFKRMTAADLVGYISNHDMFQEAYSKEYSEIVDKLQGKIINLPYSHPDVISLNNEYQNVVRTFYQEKAEILLLKKGFISKDVDYEDPDSLPGANIVEPKQLLRRLAQTSSDRFIRYVIYSIKETLETLMLTILPEQYVRRMDGFFTFVSALLVCSLMTSLLSWANPYIIRLLLVEVLLIGAIFIPTNWVIRAD